MPQTTQAAVNQKSEGARQNSTIEAEDRARRESALGYTAGSVDPAVDPSDYIWRLQNTDIMAYDLHGCSAGYIYDLARALIEGNAHSVQIFDRFGDVLFWHSPYGHMRDEVAA